MKLLFSPLLMRLTCIGLPLMIAISCKKSDSSPPPTAPAVTTAALTSITTSSATTGGTILTNGNAAITKSGIVWSKTNATPTLTDSIITSTAISGSFTINLTSLDFNTVYYIRAFATNSVGTGYGDVVTLNTTNDTTKVRFTYNGNVVVYGVIISSVTGKKWLDRNLGAQQAATAYNDWKAYGDLFQWGRPADGHQLITWTEANATYVDGQGGTPVNGTTTVLATSDTPGHSNFIVFPDTSTTGDWRSNNNSNRWVTIPQGPCPAGWHVPTLAEWMAEVSTTSGGTANSGGMTDYASAYNQLKLTIAGYRSFDGPPYVPVFKQVGLSGHYWTRSEEFWGSVSGATDFFPGPGYIQTNGDPKGYALSVRCLKD